MSLGVARMASAAAWLLLTACTAQPQYAGPKYSGPQSARTAVLNLRADGIYAHPEYPDDVVWARLYHRGSTKMLGAKKLTVEVPIAKFALDAGLAYVIEFVSTEAQSGGYTNCLARTELQPLEGARYTVTYRAAKSSCRVESSQLDAQTGHYTMLTSDMGAVGGAPYRAP